MKRHLFYTFLTIFGLTAIVTLLGITKQIPIDDFYLKGLFGAFIIELGGAVIALYRNADFFGESSSLDIYSSSIESASKSSEASSKSIEQPTPALINALEIEPKVSVHLQGSKPSLRRNEEAVEIIRVSHIKFDDIWEAVNSAPPLQREDIKKNYLGLYVEWDSLLASASKRENGQIFLLLRPEDCKTMGLIDCEVMLDDYKELGVLPEKSKIRVYGEIAKLEFSNITLNNVKLYFIS